MMRTSLSAFVSLCCLAGTALAQSDTLFVAEREDHSPYLALSPAGEPVLAWIASVPDTAPSGPYDEIALSAHGVGGWSPPEILASGGALYGPRLAFAPSGARWTCWAEHDGADSRIRVRRDDGMGGALFTLDDPSQPDLEPSICAARGDSVVVVWQGWRADNYEILMAAGDSSGFSAPAVISTCPRNDREPKVVWGGDKAWIVWSSYEGQAYNLHHRTWDGAALSPVVGLTTNTRSRNMHPAIRWDDASSLLWITNLFVNQGWNGFNQHEPGLYDLGSPRVRAYDGTTLYAPAGLDADNRYPLLPMEDYGYERFQYTPTQPMEDRFGTGLDVNIDDSGRVWFFHRQQGSLTEFGAPNTYWGLVGLNYRGGAWSAADEFAELRTSLAFEAPATLVHADTLWIAWSADDRSVPLFDPGFLNLFGHDLDLVVRAVPLTPEAPVAPTLVPLGAAVAPGVVSPEVREPFTITEQGVPMTLLWGENHRHSVDLSWDASPDPPCKETIFYSLDFLGHDWITPSDHAERFSKAIWGWVRKFAMIYDIPGRFRVFPGYERSMRGGAGGDQNAIYRDPEDFTEASAAYPDISSWHNLYAAQSGIDVIDIPHTTAQCGAVADWAHLANGNPGSLAAPLRLVEVYQSARESFEYPGCPRQYWGCVAGPDSGWVDLALASGMRVGLVSAADHTIRAAFTGVYATDVTRDAIWEGLQARRTFGTTRVHKANVEVRVNGALMGSEIHSSVPPTVTVRVECDWGLSKVEINRNGDPAWFSAIVAGTDTTITIQDTDPVVPGTSSYYYARIEDVDDRLYYSSPVWVDFVSGATDAPAPAPADGPLSVTPRPNPARGAVELAIEGLRGAPGVLRIYDVGGRLVRARTLDATEGTITWDGRDAAGARVGAGRYYLVLQGRGETARSAVTVLR